MIYIIDTVGRASRLNYAKYFKLALEESPYEIVYVGKKNACEHFSKKIIVKFSNEKWISKLKIKDLIRILFLPIKRRDIIIFPALDEVFWFLPVLKLRFSNMNGILIRYSPEDSFTYRLIKHIFAKLFVRKVFTYDERVNEFIYVNDFVYNIECAGKNIPEISSKFKKILINGLSNDRKGLSIMKPVIMNHSKTQPFFKYIITGPLPEELSRLENVHHIKEFLPEEELNSLFIMSEIIIIPYDKSFKYSSQVQVRAISLNKKTITTSHGLVGYITRNYNNGIAIKEVNDATLIQGIRKLLSKDIEEKNVDFSYQKFKEVIIENIN